MIAHGLPPDALDHEWKVVEEKYQHLRHWVAQIKHAIHATAWMKNAKLGLKASTVVFYQGHLNQHILPALAAKLVSDLRAPIAAISCTPAAQRV